MRIIQASPSDPTRAIEHAWVLGAKAIAWDLREDCADAVRAATAAKLRSDGWYSVARDPQAAEEHPEWMHAPECNAWLGGKARPDHHTLVAPYISINNREAFEYARARLLDRVIENDWCVRLWLSDIQGAPSGCGCGNPSCRSWDNSPGPKIVEESPYDLPDRFFSEEFFESAMMAIWDLDRPVQVSPVLCPQGGSGVVTGGVEEPDGAAISCRGDLPSAIDYWPELLDRFRSWAGSLFVPQLGILLMCDALGKDDPVYGSPRQWPVLAHGHYGTDLFPCVEPADAEWFEHCLVLLDAPQTFWPVPAPAGYEPALRTVNA